MTAPQLGLFTTAARGALRPLRHNDPTDPVGDRGDHGQRQDSSSTATPETRFGQFHGENPHVYELFKRFTFEAIRSGRERFSARTILHRIRWYTGVETNDPSGFKVNDHWSPYYARLFVREYPQHARLFEMRSATADAADDRPRDVEATA